MSDIYPCPGVTSDVIPKIVHRNWISGKGVYRINTLQEQLFEGYATDTQPFNEVKRIRAFPGVDFEIDLMCNRFTSGCYQIEGNKTDLSPLA
jgi:hypothetical protein